MKARTIRRGKWITQYFIVILLLAMLFNMGSAVYELYSNPAANYAWYWGVLFVGGVYMVLLLPFFIINLFFRSRAKRLAKER